MRSFFGKNPLSILAISILIFMILPFMGFAQETRLGSMDAAAPPKFSIIAPLNGDTVSDSAIFIIRPVDADQISKAEVHSMDGEPSFAAALSYGNNWTVNWDSSAAPDGWHAFEFSACNDAGCTTKQVRFMTQNASKETGDAPDTKNPSPKDEPTATDSTNPTDKPIRTELPIIFTPSNQAGAVEIHAEPGNALIVKSAGGSVTLPAGDYRADYTFNDGMVKQLFLGGIHLQESTQGAVFTSHAMLSPTIDWDDKKWTPIDSVAMEFPASPATKEITLVSNSEATLIQCDGVARTSDTCANAHEILFDPNGAHIALSTSAATFIFMRPAPRADVPLANYIVSISDPRPARFVLFNRAQQTPLADAETPLKLVEGVYDLRMELGETPIQGIGFSELSIDRSNTIVEIKSLLSDATGEIIRLNVNYSFKDGFFSVGPTFDPNAIEFCPAWNESQNKCGEKWIAQLSHSIQKGVNILRFHSRKPVTINPDVNVEIPDENENHDTPGSGSAPNPVETIAKLKRAMLNGKTFQSDLTRSRFPAFGALFSSFSISMECDSPTVKSSNASTDQAQDKENTLPAEPNLDSLSPDWETRFSPPEQARSNEDYISCDGVSLENRFENQSSRSANPKVSFLSGSPSRVKQTISVSNTTDNPLTRIIVARMISPAKSIITGGVRIRTNAEYQELPTYLEDANYFNPVAPEDSDFDPNSLIYDIRYSVPVVPSDDPDNAVRSGGEDPAPSTLSPPPSIIRFDDVNDFSLPQLEEINPEAPVQETPETEPAQLPPSQRTIEKILKNNYLRFRDNENHRLGIYSWTDYWDANTSPTTLYYQSTKGLVIETILTVNVPAHDTLTIDPVFDFANSTDFSAAWDGNANQNKIGNTYDSNSGVQLLDIDNEGIRNDLLITSVANDANGKTDSGKIILVRDINNAAGLNGLSNTNNFSVSWSGGASGDTIGRTTITSVGAGLGVNVRDLDGNGYANDLLISAPSADVNGKADSGALYMILDIDKKSGQFDLINRNNVDASWNGGTGGDRVTTGLNGAIGLIIANLDNNYTANDVIINSPQGNCGKSDNGCVYIIKDINTIRGARDLNNLNNFDVRFDGNLNASDNLGSIPFSGPSIQLVNLDNNAWANDLVIGTSRAAWGSRATAGAIYVVKDVHTKKGIFPFRLTTSFDCAFVGGATWTIGETSGNGSGIQLMDVNGDGFHNDLIITAVFADQNAANAGAVFYVPDVNSLSGIFDLNAPVRRGYQARWTGGSKSDEIGFATTPSNFAGTSDPNVQVISLDGDAGANDLIIAGSLVDFNSKTNGGAVYLIKDINARQGDFTLASRDHYTIAWTGATTNDEVGRVGHLRTSVQVLNLDGNAYANDFLFGAVVADINGKTDSGALYLIRDVNALASGQYYLGNTNFFSARWNGGAGARIGDTNNSGQGFQVLNLDNNAMANDLIITSPSADGNGHTNNGAIFIIKDFATKTGPFDLNSVASLFDARINGTKTNNFLGDTNQSGSGVQLVNVDNNAYADDLLITAAKRDNSAANTGGVYLIRDVEKLSGVQDLNNLDNFTHLWQGGSTADAIGDTNHSRVGVQVEDLDSNGYTNDLLITAEEADVNGLTNNGAIYLVRDIAVAAAPPEDHSFVLLLPSNSCSADLGNGEGVDGPCTRAWIESPTGGISVDANQVSPDGQSVGTPFLVYDNQSSTSSDFNVTLDLNADLPSTLKLKVSTLSSGWEEPCSGDTSIGCVNISSVSVSVGKMVYSIKTQDLNLYVWGDFNAAPAGMVDRNVNSTGITS